MKYFTSPRRARGPSPKPHPRPPCLWCPGPKGPMPPIVLSSWSLESRRGGGRSACLVLSIFYRDISGGQATTHNRQPAEGHGGVPGLEERELADRLGVVAGEAELGRIVQDQDR